MEKEWTIIFLIYADFRINGTKEPDTDLIREYEQLKHDLAECLLHDKMEILIIRNIVDPRAKNEKEYDTTELIRMEKGANGGLNIEKSLKKIPTLRLVQKADELGTIFKKIHNNKYEGVITRAKRYFLITWDHGSAFGIFRRNVTIRETDKPEKLLLDYYDRSDNIVGKREIFQRKVVPVSYSKTADGEYIEEKRSWENPIYRYYSDKGTLLFELNTEKPKEQFYQKLISDSSNHSVSLIEKDNRTEIEIPNINSYELIRSLTGEISIKTNHLSDSGDLDKENREGLFKNNAIDFLQFDNNEIHNNILRTDLPTTPNKILDILTNEELRDAIKYGLKNSSDRSKYKNIDVLLMMNCCMMNIHTCYALKEDVDYIVAPQGIISEPGYNYYFLIDEIRKSLEDEDGEPLEPEILGRYCINSCEYASIKGRLNHKYRIEEWAIRLIKTHNYNELAMKINDCAKELITLSNKHEIVSFVFNVVRGKCIRFDSGQTNYFMIDILHWIPECINLLNSKGVDCTVLTEMYISLQNFTDDLVISERIGNRVYADASDDYLKMRPQGTTLYFPIAIENDQEEYCYFIDKASHDQSSFLKEKEDWLKFLFDLLR